MLKLKGPMLFLLAIAIVGAMSHQPMYARRGGSRFGETFGATALGSALGSTVGTALGNAISAPKSRTETVVVKEVCVPVQPSRVTSLEREANQLMRDLDALYNRKSVLEGRIKALERELEDTENLIDVKQDSLRKIENKKKELCKPAPLNETEIEIR